MSKNHAKVGTIEINTLSYYTEKALNEICLRLLLLTKNMYTLYVYQSAEKIHAALQNS
jgi:hypothetical protein